MTFSSLGLSAPIIQAVTERGYDAPTMIQQKAIPVILDGQDVLATAQTGTGKTASFVLPILELLKDGRKRRAKRLRALVLVPTRELAIQVKDSIDHYAKHLPLKAMSMVGGMDAERQKQQLIEGVDIVVATPARLLDMLHQRALYCDELQALVLDEADRMLDMGFIGDINKIIDRLPEQRQNLLFSATLNKEVRSLASTTIVDAVEISVASEKQSQPSIEQWLVAVDKDNKSSLLSHLIKTYEWSQGLIFIRTKHGAAKLVTQLEKRGIRAESFHSGRSQVMRTQLLADFKSGEIALLVATGIAARGIDIDELSRVVNYDLPDDADEYIHRIGRTGRAGAIGEAVSLVSKDDFKRLCAIERRMGKVVERKEVEGFPVKKALPVSDLNFVPKKTRPSADSKNSSKKPSVKKTRHQQPSAKQGADKKRGKSSTSKTRGGRLDPGKETQTDGSWDQWLRKD